MYFSFFHDFVLLVRSLLIGRVENFAPFTSVSLYCHVTWSLRQSQETMTCHSSHCFSIVCGLRVTTGGQSVAFLPAGSVMMKLWSELTASPPTHHQKPQLRGNKSQWANQKARTFASSNQNKRLWSGNCAHIKWLDRALISAFEDCYCSKRAIRERPSSWSRVKDNKPRSRSLLKFF